MFDCAISYVTRSVFYCRSAFRGGEAERVGRADNTAAAGVLKDVGVDHRRLDVFVAEEFLDCSDVVASHQQVSGEGVAEGMAAHVLVDVGVSDCLFDRTVDDRVVQMVATDDASSRILAAGAGREDVLPAPVGGGIGVLSAKGFGEVDLAEALFEVLFVELLDVEEVVLESLAAGIREEGGAVFMPLTVADGDVAKRSG